MRIFLCH